jgi:hypothetical protein
MSDQNGYEARQIEWLRNTGVKRGDRVLICAKVDEWDTTTKWVSEMDSLVGRTGTVVSIAEYGIRVETGRPAHVDGWWYPFFVLVKVEDNE